MFKFTVGSVVQHKMNNIWGHVQGFTLNPTGETIIIVTFADGTMRAVHPTNLTTQ